MISWVKSPLPPWLALVGLMLANPLAASTAPVEEKLTRSPVLFLATLPVKDVTSLPELKKILVSATSPTMKVARAGAAGSASASTMAVAPASRWLNLNLVLLVRHFARPKLGTAQTCNERATICFQALGIAGAATV